MKAKTVTFKLEGDFIELNKLLKAAGLVENGAAAGFAILGSEVKADGVVELRKRCKIRRGQQVSYKGRTIIVE